MYEHLRELNDLQQQVNQQQADMERKDTQLQEALSRAAERAEIDKDKDKDKAVLAA